MAARTPAVGSVIDVPDPARVTLPDGQVRTVVGGRYVIDQDGKHHVEPAEKG